VFRGFLLGRHVIDFQLEAEIALSDSLILSVGGWYATEASGGDFSEADGFLDLRYEWEHWALGVAATYHSYTHTFFENGLDTGLFLIWSPNDDIQITAGGYYDDGPGGWYGKLEANWSHPLGDKSFVAALAGLSRVDGYYRRNGANDAYARFSWTYVFNDRVSATPFVGASLSTGSGPASGSNHLWGGLWFEVNF
jgi:outer membrane scaffolding protein for murein synthesis (MipA/OmpV family)